MKKKPGKQHIQRYSANEHVNMKYFVFKMAAVLHLTFTFQMLEVFQKILYTLTKKFLEQFPLAVSDDTVILKKKAD